MKAYNKMIADMVLQNIHNDIRHTPQPETLSLYGGKRVRDHPQCGHTQYSEDSMTLLPNHNLLTESLYNGGSFWGDIGNSFKSVGNEVFHDVVLPVAKDVGKDALQSYLKGKGRGRPKGKGSKKGGDFWNDLKNVGKSVGSEIMPVVKEVGKEALKDYLMKGKGVKKVGRPKKNIGGGIGDDILHGIEQFAPIAMMGLGRKKKSVKGGASELYPKTVQGGAVCGGNKKTSRGLLIKKIMKEHGLNLPQASKYIKEHSLKY
jgi:hypothetical protein